MIYMTPRYGAQVGGQRCLGRVVGWGGPGCAGPCARAGRRGRPGASVVVCMGGIALRSAVGASGADFVRVWGPDVVGGQACDGIEG